MLKKYIATVIDATKLPAGLDYTTTVIDPKKRLTGMNISVEASSFGDVESISLRRLVDGRFGKAIVIIEQE